jgi:hypothetical protein
MLNLCRINIRLIRISFEKMEPQLIGRDKITAEINLRKAMKNAYKSVGIATAYMNQCIQKSLDCGKGNIRTMSERHDKPTALLHQEGNKVGKM